MGELKARAKDNFKEMVVSEFVGRGIMTAYNNRVYVVDDVEFDTTPTATFTMRQGGEEKEVSYADFYKNRYSVEIKEMG